MSDNLVEVVLDSRKVYSGSRIAVNQTTIRTSRGHVSCRDVVVHPPVVVVAPLISDTHLLMVKQYRTAVGKVLLEVPAGVIETGECPDEAAQRELREEVGYRSEKLREVFGAYPTPGFCTEYMYFFVADSLVQDPLPADFDEDISVVTVLISDALKMIATGEIMDLKSISLITYLNTTLSQ